MTQAKATPTFKFKWVPNTKPVTNRPVNELDQKPGYVNARGIEALVRNFLTTPAFARLKKLLTEPDYKIKRKGKPQRYSQTPIPKKIAIRLLHSALAVQRDIDFDHLIKIILNWDSRRPATVNVIGYYNKKTKKITYYITDGQHTVMASAIRAILGLFPDIDPSKWLDYEVNCQVVETNDFSFAREHFLGINGADKLSITAYDKHKIHVFGKRLDSPHQSTQDLYEIANKIQLALEAWDLIPVDQNSPDRFKAGAVLDVNRLGQIEVDDARFFGENHATYWPQEPLDSIEIMPFQALRKKLVKEGADFSTVEFKEFMRDINALVKEVAGGWPEFKNLTQSLYPAYYEDVTGEKALGLPADASLVLLLQLYLKAGGTYQYVPRSIYTRYSENNSSMFKKLPQVQKDKFK